MSDSTPAPSGADPASGISPMRWWIASILFHGALAIYLLFFSPVRVIDPKAKASAGHVSAAQARKVIDQIRERQAPTMEANLRTLSAIGQKMSELEQRKRGEFVAYAREMGRDIPEEAAKEQRAVEEAQAAAQSALALAGDAAARALKQHTNASFDELKEAQQVGVEKQALVLRLQEQLAGLLSLGDERMSVAAQALVAAAEAQTHANDALAAAQEARGEARGSRKRTRYEEELEHYTYEVRRARQTIENSESDFAMLQKQVAVAGEILKRVKQRAEEGVSGAAPPVAGASEAAQKAIARAERNLAAAQRKLENAPKSLASARKRLPELEAKLNALLAQPDLEAAAPTAQDSLLGEKQKAAIEAQAQAVCAQAKVGEAISALQGLQPRDSAGADALAALDKAAPAEAVPAVGQPGSDLARIYATAQATEAGLTQSYRRLRAMDLALARRVPLAKAADLTVVAKPVRPDLTAALQSTVGSGDEAVAAREAVQTAKGQVDAMVRLADSLLSQAQNSDAAPGATISLEDYNRQFGDLQVIEQMAAEDGGQWAVDLTGEGTGDGAAGSGAGGGAAEGGGGGGGGGSGGVGGAGNGGPDLGMSGTEGPFSDGAGPGGFGFGGIAGAGGAFERPEDVSARVRPAPGRRIASSGDAAVPYLYADSWYIIGPFDNTGRRNIDKKFPPETVIDLNAKYAGKNGVEVGWEFQQSGAPNVSPHFDAYVSATRDPVLGDRQNYENSVQYIIYYAYTELWFERECDLWVAVGSDDYSKIWIEDKLIWSSGKNLKAWRLNEGLRKVHFKQGINRVLCRIENGNGPTEFSFVVSMLP